MRQALAQARGQASLTNPKEYNDLIGVAIDHVHMVRVSVREHATLIRDRLRRWKVWAGLVWLVVRVPQVMPKIEGSCVSVRLLLVDEHGSA